MNIRSPIIVVLGHVGAGKTSLLDKIRNTTLTKYEAGFMTQHIGATEVPRDIIIDLAKPLLNIFKFDIKIPSLLFLDTPGHEAFTNLRKRGGSVADFAIIVVDILEGFQPQTYEAIEICKQFKVPFLVALNKIDRIEGWKSVKTSFLENIRYQDEKTLSIFESKLYENVIKLYEIGFESERFDRIKDFKKTVSIVPISAKTGEGIPELLLLISGLSQRFLEEKLKINVEGPGRGVILERKEEKGYGTVIDVILYDGKIKKGDNIAFITKNGIKTTKIRAILKPKPLQDIRFSKTKFYDVDEVYAASGIRISAENLEEAIPGSEIIVYNSEEELDKIRDYLKKSLEEILFTTNKEGIIIKADTLGSLEAIVKILKDKNIPIAKADIGNIDKEDIDLLLSLLEKNNIYSFILGFNVGIDKNIENVVNSGNFPIIIDNVIYNLIDKFLKKIEEKKKEKEILLPNVGKIKILHGFIFRRSSPAIVGVEILSGKIKKGNILINGKGKILGKILSIQEEKQNIEEATKNMKVAIAIENGVVGRNIDEGDILYTYISEEDYRLFKQNKDKISDEDKQILKEIAEIMRKDNPTWGL